MSYERIDKDLTDGKICCLCCNLEAGFNLLGIPAILYAWWFGLLYSAFAAANAESSFIAILAMLITNCYGL